jgi:hypothetical protein
MPSTEIRELGRAEPWEEQNITREVMAKHDALPSIENQQMAMPFAYWNILHVESRRSRIAE